MSIKVKGKKGIYHCDFYSPEGKRVRQSLHTRNREEAQELEAKLISDGEARTVRLRKNGITLTEAFHHALRVREQWRSAKRLDSIVLIYKSLEDRFGANCALSKINDEALLDYAERLKRRCKAASTINKRFSLVSVLFDEAINWGKYKGKKPHMVRYRIRNARRRLITPAEEAGAISLCNQESPYESAMVDLIVVLADTGLRLSEALGIQPEHVDIESKAVMVVDTKTGDDRVVPLTQRAMEVLQRRNVAPVFQPLNAYVVSHIWRRIRKKMGLEHDREFVLHSFRHTFGSTLANAGTDSFRLQKVMGHKNIQSTQRYIKVSAAALMGLSSIMEERTRKYQMTLSSDPEKEDGTE